MLQRNTNYISERCLLFRAIRRASILRGRPFGMLHDERLHHHPLLLQLETKLLLQRFKNAGTGIGVFGRAYNTWEGRSAWRGPESEIVGMRKTRVVGDHRRMRPQL